MGSAQAKSNGPGIAGAGIGMGLPWGGGIGIGSRGASRRVRGQTSAAEERERMPTRALFCSKASRFSRGVLPLTC